MELFWRTTSAPTRNLAFTFSNKGKLERSTTDTNTWELRDKTRQTASVEGQPVRVLCLDSCWYTIN
jgi:hypothetical protein